MRGHKVRAFTIIEVSITMLISAIVIGISYYAYSIVSRSYVDFKDKNDGLAAMVQLDHLLRKDFAHADTIFRTPNGISVKYSFTTVDYQFQPDYIVRANLIIDTFKFKTDSVNTLFENEPIIDINTIPEQNQVDELEFLISNKDGKFPYHYHKDYSSANLIQRNPNAIN